MKKNMQHVADRLFDVRNQIQADRCSLFLIDHKAKEMYIQAGDITLRLRPGGAARPLWHGRRTRRRVMWGGARSRSRMWRSWRDRTCSAA